MRSQTQALGRAAFAGVALLAVLAGVGGCSGSDSKSASSSVGHDDAATVAAAPTAAGEGSYAAAAAPARAAAPQDQSVKRSVVRTASLSVTASDVDAAAGRVARIAVEQGGRVEGDERTGTGSKRTATMVVRVLPAHLETAMTVVAALGKETKRSLEADDVTQTTVDLGARTAALSTSVQRLRHLLSTSANVDSLLAVEKQLSSREAELESLQAQKTALATQVSLATLTVALTTTTPKAAVVKARTGVHPTGFGSAFGSGVHAVAVGVRLVGAGLGYALPVLVPVGVLVLLVWGLGRRPRTADATAPAGD